MRRRNRAWLAGAAIAVGAAAFATNGTFAQAGRAPDIAGEWRLDQGEDPGQPPAADYLGLALNEAGRLRADTTPESVWGTPEYQCRPHSAPHQWRGVGGARILKELDPMSRDIRGYRVQFMRSLDRPIYLDGRPEPPGYAPHSWSGFSTGRVGRADAQDHDHPPEGRVPEAGRLADQRHADDDGVHHPPRRHHDDRAGSGRPDLPRRALCAVDHLFVRPERRAVDGELQRQPVRGKRRHRSPSRTAFPAGTEQRHR